MKNTFLKLLLLITLAGCCRDDAEPVPDQLRELRRPDVITNELARGELLNGFPLSVTQESAAGQERYWHFEAMAGTRKIKRIIVSDPNYYCEDSQVSYTYNDHGLIGQVVAVRKNVCLEFTATTVYQYRYQEGLLVAITSENFISDKTTAKRLVFKGENHFSYYPDGKVEAIYSNFRDVSVESNKGYQKRSFTYNGKGNITSVRRQEFHTADYDELYMLEYGDCPNPLQGIYLPQLQLPSYGFAGSLGPNALSPNCVESISSEYLYIDKPPRVERFSTTVLDGKVQEFGSYPDSKWWQRYRVQY